MKKLFLVALFAVLFAPLGAKAQSGCATSCPFTISCTDSYGDGWNGNAIQVYQADSLLGTATLTSGNAGDFSFLACGSSDTNVYFIWVEGSFAYEASFTIYKADGTELMTGNGGSYSDGDTIAWMANNCPTCIAPSNLTFDANTLNSITFHWTPGGTEFAWEVMVGDSIISDVATSTLTVDNLSASSRYEVKVRAVCSADDTSSWTPVVEMQTQCGSITTLPWSCDFEGNENYEIPLCWSMPARMSALDYDGDTSDFIYCYNDSYYAHSGQGSLYSYLYTGYGMAEPGPGIIASPFFQHDPTDLHVTFWLASSYFPTGVTFEAGVISDLADTSTFMPLMQVTPDDLTVDYSYTHTQFEFYTSSITTLNPTDSVCVAFRISMNDMASNLYFYIDDIVVDEIGDCLSPTLNSGNVDSVSYQSVNLSWQCAGEPDGYYVKLVSDNNEIGADALETQVEIGNLPSNTYFEAYVASVCGTDTTDYVYLGSFTTHYRCYPVQNPEVVALTANAAALAWSYAGTGIEPASVDIVLNDLTSPTTPTTVSVTGTNSIFSGLTEGHLYEAIFFTYCGDSDTSWSVSVNFMPHTPPCAEFTGNDVSNYIPFYSFYNNGFSEMLYAGTDVAGVDTLTGITFQVANPLNRNNIIDIYMGYASDSVTGITPTSYIPVSEMTQVVANYSLNTGSEGWTDIIPFDTPFATQPTGNLVIAVYNHTGSYSSGLQWAVHTGTVGSSAYCYTDNSISVDNPYSGNTSTVAYAPNIQLYGNCGGGDCVAPGVSVVSTEEHSVTLNWLPGGSESSWQVQYRQNGNPAWTSAGTATTVPFTVSGLNAGTAYQFRVGADCGDTVVYSSAVNASTLCGLMNAPFSIIPDGENYCWTYLGPGYSYNGYYIYNGGTIISPAIADSINTLQLRVSVHGDPYKVGICNADGSVVTWLDTVYPGSSDDYHTMKTYLHHYEGTENHVVVSTVLTGDYYTYFELISIEPLDNCMFVENLAVDNVTTTEAWLSWESEGNNFEVSYMRESDTTATWSTPITVNTNSVHLTGLASNDRYYVKVYNVCSATERSDSSMIRFASGCTDYTVPFSEDFGLTDMPVCWNTVSPTITNNTWASTVVWGYNYVYSTASASSEEYNDWLMTPNIQIPASADNVKLVYLVGGGPSTYYSNTAAAYQVLVSTTGNGSVANYTDTILFDSVDTYNSSSWSYGLNYKRLSLAAYAGQTISIAFRNTSRQYGVVYLGTIEVRETVDPVYYVYGNNSVFVGDTATFEASYQEGDQTTMTLQWTSAMAAAGHAVMTGATTENMSIVYSTEGVDTITFIATNAYAADTTRFPVYVYDCSPVTMFPFTESFETATAPAGCWTLVYGDNEPTVNPMLHVAEGDDSYFPGGYEGSRAFRFSSYSNSSDYNQYLISRELAGTGMTLSFWYRKGSYGDASVDNIRVGYSSTTSDTAAFTWGEWITDITTADWANFTDSLPEGTKYVAIQYWGNYAYYIYIDDVVINGVSSICNAPSLAAPVAGENTIAINWVGATDSYEVAIAEGAWVEPTSATVVTDTFYTFTGLTDWTAYTVGVRAVCGNSYYSDWTTLSATTLRHPCAMPTGVTVSNPTFEGATVSWTLGEAENQWEVRVFCTSPQYEALYTVNDNPTLTVTGLDNGVTYSVTVRAMCDSNWYSEWTEPVALTTTACPQVTNVNHSDVTATSATISWTGTASSYEIEYGKGGFPQGSGTTVTVTSNSVILANLEELTTYDVYVRSVCSDSVYSLWSTKYTFSTPEETGIDDVENGNVALYPNPASTTVTVSGIEGLSTVTVVDLNGRVVFSANAESSLTIDVSGYAKGAYFVRITGERTTAVRKLVVR